MDTNLQTYSSAKAVKTYAGQTDLRPGEVRIFEKYKDKLTASKLLDVGIGAGRTSRVLIPMVREYVGIDYSPDFVEYCSKAFSAESGASIMYGDARNLRDFADGSFDFILFSFNGIDYVDLDGRKQILSEFSRVIKNDGVLVFSFHNKGNLDKLYSFQFPKNPFKYPGEWKRMKTVKAINGNKELYKNKEWFIIKDGGEEFSLDTYYGDPLHEQNLLRELGFKKFSFYESLTGKELAENNVQASETPWIYIVATK